MFRLPRNRLVPVALLALAVVAEIAALRATWTADTQNHPNLQSMKVRSDYELLLENTLQRQDEPILSYTATAEHNHRLTVSMESARLSPESLRLLAPRNPPEGAARLVYGPDSEAAPSAGEPCLIAFKVQFPPHALTQTRSVRLYPPQLHEVIDRATTRLIHLQSSSELAVFISANSPGGLSGEGCRHRLTIGSWEQTVGKNFELAFVAAPESRIDLTLSSTAFHSGQDEIESLEIEPLHPTRLSILPIGVPQVTQTRQRVGPPYLTLTNLRLGGNFLDVDVSGMVGLPVSELLGGLKWPLFALLDLPLVAWALKSVPRFKRRRTPVMGTQTAKEVFDEERLFLSYSRDDEERVLPIYELLKDAGAGPWIDREQLRGGVEWEADIQAQMRKSKRVLIFLSNKSLHRRGYAWVEIRLAVDLARELPDGEPFIIPLKLDDCELPSMLGRWHAIELFRVDGKERLLAALGQNKVTIGVKEAT